VKRPRRRSGRPPAVLTPTEAIAKYGLTYKQLFDATRAGLLHPYSGDPRNIRSFRAFMASEGLGHPDETWAPEDVEAWKLDEGAPPE
jgi:hypothetical protein